MLTGLRHLNQPYQGKYRHRGKYGTIFSEIILRCMKDAPTMPSTAENRETYWEEEG